MLQIVFNRHTWFPVWKRGTKNENSDTAIEEAKPFIDDSEQLSNVSDSDSLFETKPHYLKKNVLWPVCSGLLSMLYIFLSVQQRRFDIGSYERGFKTEFQPALPAIEIVEYEIGGWLWPDEKGHLHRQLEPGPQYVGYPSPEIDKSWDDLMYASEIVVNGEDAKTVAGKTVEEPDHTGWRMELDVYHSLHCVDVVRKAIDVDYYYPGGKLPYFYRDHVDHCVDYLRQALQCQADLSPIRYTSDTAVPVPIPVFDGKHTCRNFDKIHEWSKAHTGFNAAWKLENGGPGRGHQDHFGG